MDYEREQERIQMLLEAASEPDEVDDLDTANVQVDVPQNNVRQKFGKRKNSDNGNHTEVRYRVKSVGTSEK